MDWCPDALFRNAVAVQDFGLTCGGRTTMTTHGWNDERVRAECLQRLHRPADQSRQFAYAPASDCDCDACTGRDPRRNCGRSDGGAHMRLRIGDAGGIKLLPNPRYAREVYTGRESGHGWPGHCMPTDWFARHRFPPRLLPCPDAGLPDQSCKLFHEQGGLYRGGRSGSRTNTTASGRMAAEADWVSGGCWLPANPGCQGDGLA